MNQKVFQIMSVIVAFALTFGGFTSAGAAPQMAGTTYYVATTGNDANAGTSAAPFKTIQKCASVAGSGMICSVAAGTYAERVNVTRAGIVFQGNGLVTMQGFQISADNVSVKGFYVTGMASTLVGVDISAKTCVIENNHVYYAPRGGISLASSSSGCVVRNNKLEKNSQWGLSVDGANHTIEGNEIWNTIQYHPQWTNPPSWVDADGIRFFGTGHVIRNNYIHDIKFDEVYNKTAHIDCFQTWTSGTANILFEGNKCQEMYVHLESASGSYMKAQGFMIEGGAHDITIRNNVINAYRAINLGDSGDTTTTNNIFILNNTIVGAIPVQLGIDEYGIFVTKATAVTAKNNIFYNVLGHSIYGAVAAGYNLHYRGDGKPLWNSPASNDLWNVNPLLTTDYHLTASSPARGKAEGGGDMGAYPYIGAPVATATIATIISTATPLNTPVVTLTPAATALTPTASPVVSSPTPTASAIPASPTATPLVNPTASSAPASSTPTASISARGSQRILQPTIFDCKNGIVADIRIENTHDVTIKNCNVAITSGNGIQITDSYNIIIDNVDISNTYAEGSGINLESTTSGSTHNITIQNFHIHGAMGWGIAGSNAVLKDITVRNGLIEDIGKAGGSQKHGLYINNWQTFLIEDVTVLRSWNTGVKIVGDTTDGVLRRVIVKDSGKSGSSGPGISLGDSRVSHMARLTFEYCNIQNSINPAIWVLDTLNGANYVTVDHCYFKNNYYAVQIPKGAIGWKVTNNVGYNQATYSVARPPLQFEGGDADVAANYFDYNNWYFDGNNPVRVSGTTLSFPQWQAKGVDQHGMSVNPGSVTATPSVVPAFTSTLKAVSPTPTASVPAASATSTVSPSQALSTPTTSSIPASATPVPASPTPTASSIPASATPVPASPTPTASSIPASATPTASPVPALPTSTSQPAVPPTSTPQVDRQTSEKVYDDKDGGFVYSPGWQDVTNKRAYGGSYKQTNIKDSSVTFTFTGQSFSVMYTSGPAFRKMDVYVDGLLVGSINEKGRTNFQKRWDYSGQLASGSHTLKLVFVGSAGTSTSVDAVIVR